MTASDRRFAQKHRRLAVSVTREHSRLLARACTLGLQLPLANLEHKEVKVLCQPPQDRAAVSLSLGPSNQTHLARPEFLQAGRGTCPVAAEAESWRARESALLGKTDLLLFCSGVAGNWLLFLQGTKSSRLAGVSGAGALHPAPAAL